MLLNSFFCSNTAIEKVKNLFETQVYKKGNLGSGSEPQDFVLFFLNRHSPRGRQVGLPSIGIFPGVLGTEKTLSFLGEVKS